MNVESGHDTSKYRKKSAFPSQEFKSHGWWIQGGRGPNAPPKQGAKLFNEKEPIAMDPRTGLEFYARTIFLVSIDKKIKM
jgi:hypothetical protein